MKPRAILIIAALGLGATAWLGAQGSLRPTRDGMLRPFWECTTPAGTFVVPLDRISNVSTHQFIVQGAGRVWEVVIADDSSSIARFYYMEPASKMETPVTGDDTARYTEEALKEAAQETKTDRVWEKVVKTYPDATHAHTVEYRLESRKALTKLFEHLRESWMAGRPARLVLKKEED